MQPDENTRGDAAACDFLAMFESDLAAGRQRTLPDYQLRFPGFERRIACEFAALAADGAHAADQGGAGAAPRRLGRYRLVRELGRGGQGVVWLAHDEGLDRQVALKVLDDGGWSSQARRERLQREANALARLDHPGICAIYEAELGGPTPFLAMRFVAGETLAARLRRAAERPEPDAGRLLAALPDRPAAIARVLELGERIARALHAAHEAGIVHRDVKPQNVMLAADDQPVVLDFGVARVEEGDALVRTRSGELFGSIAYLPPERLTGSGPADRRGDVWALGVMLHECLTLQRPYAAATTAALVAEVAAGRRPDPCRRNRALPRDVALVLATALEPDPARRYASALDFAADLRRLRHHEPIAARPIGARLRLQRWLRRHPVLGVAGALLVAALLVTATLLVQLIAQRRGLLAWQQVLEAMSSGAHPVDALGRVLAAAPHVPEQKLDGPLIDLLTRSATRIELGAGRLGGAPVAAPFFSADDRELAVPTATGELVRVDVATGDCSRHVVLHPGADLLLRVAAGGRTAVSSGHDGRVRHLDAATWTDLPLPAAIAGSNADVDRIDDPENRLPRLPLLSRDGARLLLLGYDGALLGCTLAAEGVHWRRDRPGWWAQQGVFAPDGRTFVIRWQHGRRQQGAEEVGVYDSGDGRELQRLDVGGQETMCCAFAADGGRLAVGGMDGVVRVFDTADWRATCELRAGGEDLAIVYWVGFAPDGSQLIALGWDGLSVWDLGTRARVAHHVAADARPFHVGAFSDDGRRFAAVVKDGSVRFYAAASWTEIGSARWTHRYPNELVWNHRGDAVAFQDGRGLQVTGLQAPAPESRPHREAIVSLEFLPDGRHVLTASRDATAAVVDLDSGLAEPVFRHPAPVRRARLAAGGERIVTACEDGVVRVFGRRDGAVLQALPLHDGPVIDARFVAGDSRLLSIGRDGRVQYVDVATGRPVAPLRAHRQPCLALAVDEQLGLIATGGADHRVLVHDLAGAPVADLPTLPPGDSPGLDIQGNAEALAFDRARRRLVVANRRDALLVFAIDGWQPTWVRSRTHGQEYSNHLALASGGAFYATAHSGVGDWTFVDAATLQPDDVGAAGFPSAIVAVLRFSPDARLLLVASRDDTVSLWDLARRERQLELRGQHGGVRAAAFDGAGEWVATGSQDGTLRAWPVQPLPFARRHWAVLAGRPAGS